MWPGQISILSHFLGSQNIAAEGSVTAGAAQSVQTTITGAGTLQLTNTDAAKTMYLAGGGRAASTASFPLQPGTSVSWPLADVTSVTVFGTGGSLGFVVLQGKG